MSVKAQLRTAAVLEVLGVYLASELLMVLLVRMLNPAASNPLERLTSTATDAELLNATGQLFVLLLLQYASCFLLIIPVNWWHRCRGWAAYGLTTAGRSWTALLLAGGATAALAAWPSASVMLADAVYDLGDTVPWRQALFDMSWRRWQFWLFMAVLSFALIPILEELFYRGYCQRRLAEDWGDGPAIVGTSLLFVFTHGQYLIANAYNVSLIAALIVLSVGLGVVFAWTRSLIPSIFAHALINIPLTPLWQTLVLAGFVITALLIGRRGWAVMISVFRGARAIACLVLGGIGIAWAILAHRIGWLQYLAIAMLVSAVILETFDRRRQHAAPSLSPGA